MNVVALTMVHDRILHEGAKRCEGTVALYTVGAKARLGRALGGATAGIRDTTPP